jgi:hypothetical protein
MASHGAAKRLNFVFGTREPASDAGDRRFITAVWRNLCGFVVFLFGFRPTLPTSRISLFTRCASALRGRISRALPIAVSPSSYRRQALVRVVWYFLL